MIINTALVLAALLATAQSMEARYLCGAQLADMLELVCADRGFNWEVSKRSATDEGSTLHSNNIPVRKRSVVDECCRQACTLSDLEAYCAPGPEDLDPDYLLERFIQLPSWGSGSVFSQRQRTNERNHPIRTNPLRPRQLPHKNVDLVSSRQNSRGRPADIFKNRPYFFVTPSRRDFNVAKTQ